MPANVVKTVSEKCGMSEAEAEKLWKDAKKAAADEGKIEEYDYIMGIFKKMVGKDCMKTMGWMSEDIINRINDYLND